MPKHPCSNCQETGKVNCPHCTAKELSEKHCKKCSKTGKVKCPICNGNGEVGFN